VTFSSGPLPASRPAFGRTGITDDDRRRAHLRIEDLHRQIIEHRQKYPNDTDKNGEWDLRSSMNELIDKFGNPPEGPVTAVDPPKPPLDGILAECKAFMATENAKSEASRATMRIITRLVEVMLHGEPRTQHPPKHHE
jgi:hypothetical protein